MGKIMEFDGVKYELLNGMRWDTRLSVLEAKTEVLDLTRLPGCGRAKTLELTNGGTFPQVKKIIVTENISNLYFRNRQLPSLEEFVFADNEYFSFADGLLTKNSYDGKHLFRVFAKGTADLGKDIQQIDDWAFEGTTCDIRFENPSVKISKDSFSGSLWLRQREGTTAMAGNTIVHIDENTVDFAVPENADSIVLQGKEKDRDTYHIRTLLIQGTPPLLAKGKEEVSLWYFLGVQKAVLSGTADRRLVHTLFQLSSLDEIVTRDSNYKAVDGVLYTADQKKLCVYPERKRDVEFFIPEGTERIAKNAFLRQTYLRRLILPDSVSQIGAAAFYGSRIREICFGSGIHEITGEWPHFSQGAFSGSNIESVSIPDSVSYIGKNAFLGCPLQSVHLSEGIRWIDSGAFAKSGTDFGIDGPGGADTIVLPKSLERLGCGSFYGYKKLSSKTAIQRGLSQPHSRRTATCQGSG